MPVYEREIIDTNPSFEDVLKDLRERRSGVLTKKHRFEETET